MGTINIDSCDTRIAGRTIWTQLEPAIIGRDRYASATTTGCLINAVWPMTLLLLTCRVSISSCKLSQGIHLVKGPAKHRGVVLVGVQEVQHTCVTLGKTLSLADDLAQQHGLIALAHERDPDPVQGPSSQRVRTLASLANDGETRGREMTSGAQHAIPGNRIERSDQGRLCARAERRFRWFISRDDDDVARQSASLANAIEHRGVHDQHCRLADGAAFREQLFGEAPLRGLGAAGSRWTTVADKLDAGLSWSGP